MICSRPLADIQADIAALRVARNDGMDLAEVKAKIIALRDEEQAAILEGRQ